MNMMRGRVSPPARGGETVDYMREINAFYEWLGTNPISDAARNLWHALMHTANRAGWISEFTVAISHLESKTGMSRSAIYRARNELKTYGRITFRNRDGNQCSIYSIIPFVCHTDTQSGTQMQHKAERKPNANATQSGTITGTSYPTGTRTKTKTNTNTSISLPSYVDQNLMSMTPGNWEDMRDLMESGVTDELVIHAIDEANAQGIRTWAYTRTMLNRWLVKGIRTVGDAKADSERHKMSLAKPPQPTLQVVQQRRDL